MKIKFLLMPSAIIVAIVVIIWHIWPAWLSGDVDNSVTVLKSQIKEEQVEIDKIKNKKKNISSLTASLQRDADTKNLVFSYYPVVRKDEDIINKINHISFGSGVFLTGINVEYSKIDKKNDIEEILAIDSEEEVSMNDAEKILLAGNNKKTLPQFISAEINIYGDYEQIKNFLYSLYATGLLNNVQSFDVYKEENANVEGADTSGNKLSADVKVNFGYVAKKNSEAIDLVDDPLFGSGSFNLNSISENKDLMSEKYPNSEIGERGILNPFNP